MSETSPPPSSNTVIDDLESTATAVSSSTTAAPVAGNKGTANQLRKLKDANEKYKSLLKLAKGRIQAQEEEMDKMKGKETHLSHGGIQKINLIRNYQLKLQH